MMNTFEGFLDLFPAQLSFFLIIFLSLFLDHSLIHSLIPLILIPHSFSNPFLLQTPISNSPIMNECLITTVMKKGSRYCSNEGLNSAINFINSFRGDPLQVYCRDFTKDRFQEMCHSFAHERQIPPNFDVPEPKYYYYFVPLIESLLRR